MVRIAVTGGIASGKSLVGAILSQEGVSVRDADDIAHEILGPGSAVLDRVVATFGDDILGPDGSLDRARLGAMVFESGEKLAALNAIVHPEIVKRWTAWLEDQDRLGITVAAVLVPLLFEIGCRREAWSLTLCVSATTATRLARLTARGLPEAEARKRIAAQWPERKKMKMADCVIWNEGSRDLLRKQTLRLLGGIMEMGHGR